ncbi:hypothetical protein ACO0SA_004363 [Hanseniaspora valbyensis]
MSSLLNISDTYFSQHASPPNLNTKTKPSISLEFFPPKTKIGLNNLIKRIERLTIALQPIFITVTYSQLNSAKTLELIKLLTDNSNFKNVNICCHLTCTNHSISLIDEALETCKKLGIKNILALRGDPIDIEDTNNNNNNNGDIQFKYAVDLVRYIKQKYGDTFCIGVAAYPEGHYNNDYNPVTKNYTSSQNYGQDLIYLKEKLDAGASFIITQLFYNADKFLSFYNAYKEMIPDYKKYLMIPGIMPINNFMIFNRATKLAHVDIPKELIDRFPVDIRNDDDQVRNIGVNIMIEIIERIYNETNKEVNIFHFYTLNLEKSIAQIISNSSLLSQILEDSDDEDEDEEDDDEEGDEDSEVEIEEEEQQQHDYSYYESAIVDDPYLRAMQNTKKTSHTSEEIKIALQRDSDMEEDEDIVFDNNDDDDEELEYEANEKEIAPSDGHYATKTPDFKNPVVAFKRKRSRSSQSSMTSGLLSSVLNNTLKKPFKQHKKLIKEISKGTNPQLGKTILWDEFTNGRFGDSRSPAFGEMDGYGPTLKVAPHKALQYWSNPTRIEHLTEIFEQYLLNSIPVLPWCDLVGLSPETGLIQEQLLELINDCQYLTTSSQPSCNGISSDDKIFGWGPSNGKVYQKAFVEFFIKKEKWDKLKQRLDNDERFGYYCGTPTHFESSLSQQDNIKKNNSIGNGNVDGSSCVVTWGVFSNSEIQQTTILEEESFKAWCEEAFQLWKEWAKIFPRDSESYKFISSCYDDFYLVEVVYHDFSDFDGLWDFLLYNDDIDVEMN